MLLGERLIDEDGSEVNMADPRIKAGVVIPAPGNRADLSAFAAAASSVPSRSKPDGIPVAGAVTLSGLGTNEAFNSPTCADAERGVFQKNIERRPLLASRA